MGNWSDPVHHSPLRCTWIEVTRYFHGNIYIYFSQLFNLFIHFYPPLCFPPRYSELFRFKIYIKRDISLFLLRKEYISSSLRFFNYRMYKIVKLFLISCRRIYVVLRRGDFKIFTVKYIVINQLPFLFFQPREHTFNFHYSPLIILRNDTNYNIIKPR